MYIERDNPFPGTDEVYSTYLENLRLITKATDYVIISNAEDKIIWVNEGFTRITGYALHNVFGKSPRSLLRGFGSDRETIRMIDEQAAKRIPFRAQILNYDKTGAEIWLSLNVNPVFNEQMEFVKYITIGSDITELKKLEFLRTRSEFRMKLLNEISIDMHRSDNSVDACKAAIETVLGRYKKYARMNAALFDETHDKVNFIAAYSNTPSIIHEGLEIRLSDFSGLNEISTARYRMVKDMESLSSCSVTDRLLIGDEMRSYLILPLRSKARLHGSLNVASEKVADFDQNDIEFFCQLATMLSSAIRQHELMDKVSEQSHELEHKNREIMDSIRYARNIQQAILPDDKRITAVLPDSFVLYRPKDIVSGDFYWFAERNDKVFFAAADCTGHGVPGAFMSMIGSSILNQIVHGKKISSANEILTELRAKIIRNMHQEGSSHKPKDGMDIVFCVWDRKKNTLEFSGAHNPLFLIRENTPPLLDFYADGQATPPDEQSGPYSLYEIRADRMPVGYQSEDMKPFTNHEFKLQRGDTIYLLSDGYTDQFGGERNKKFMSKRLKQLLLGFQNVSMKQQKILLNRAFNAWKGYYEQVDDVLVIGLKF